MSIPTFANSCRIWKLSDHQKIPITTDFIPILVLILIPILFDDVLMHTPILIDL